ncbi:GntR family transcriptional regulator [Georgenia daeguensis]|uniref:GntR family transcriptional regulator n=1 Tax=Georgenia daeguensis TaxID=908355 RepID=A0ABP8EVM6_9MICO
MRTPTQPQETADVFSPIRPGSLVATVREQIRDAILGGQIKAGEQVRDSVLATKMNVSRAPVREALRLLEQSGLVEKTANKPYRVKSFAEEDLLELAVLRIAIETTAARVVVAQGRDVTEMHEALAQMRLAWEERSDAGLDAADWLFHRALVRASGVGRLLAKYDELVDQIILAWQRLSEDAPRKAGSLLPHEELLQTLERCAAQQDPDDIAQLLVDHIRSGMGCDDLKI